MENEKVPAAPVLAELDQEAFAAGWADGWAEDVSKERVYFDRRSPEATAYYMGVDLVIRVKAAKAGSQDN